MTTRRARRVVLIGLGILAGAVLPGAAAAQVPLKPDTTRRPVPTRPDDTRPTPGDTAKGRVRLPAPVTAVPLPPRADSMIRNDSVAQGILGRGEQRLEDTLKAPFARGEAATVLEVGASRIYDRASIYATGALTLSDLLSRVPGLTGYATGWTIAPTGVASQGDFRGIRIFLDGLELDPMDQREQGRAPINELPLHMLEELRIERGADEVRVHARSWRVSSTTPYTRADVLTGDQNTNIFRGYFGRRFSTGDGLQVSAEQASTQPTSRLPSADQRSFLVRLGRARGPWSADVMASRSDVTRGAWTGQGNPVQQVDTIAPLAARRTTAYVRLANGDPDSTRWLQLVASSHGFLGNSARSDGDTLVDRDSSAYENQYVASGGLRAGPLRVSVTERLRAVGRSTYSVPSARLAFVTEPLSISAFGEAAGPLQPARVQVTARAQAFGRISLLGAASRTDRGIFQRVLSSNPPTPVIGAQGGFTEVALPPIGPDTVTVNRYELLPRNSARAEAGIRLFDVWVSGGLIRRGETTLLSAAGLGPGYGDASTVRQEASATARTVALRGRVWKAVNVDAWGIAWDDSTGLYRPKYQSRAELYLQTSLLDRFPRGNFGILASLAHEYRSNSKFATRGDTVRTAIGSRTLDFKLEIRIQSAVISYQFRNLLQENRAQVPGFFLPRQTQVYGVRWEFWN